MNDAKFFARLNRRLLRQSSFISVITISKSQYGVCSEVDVILYRFLKIEFNFSKEDRYEMVRFLPADKELAFSFFPHGPPFLNSGPAWRQTTDWLTPVVGLDKPIHHVIDLVRIDNYPQKLPPHFVMRK